MTNVRSLVAGTLVAVAFVLSPVLAAGSAPTIFGRWKVVASTVAPWVSADEAKAVDQTELKGKTIVFANKRIKSNSVLGCDHVNYEPIDYEADALFQGGLPAPAEPAARKLGFLQFPVPSVSVNCDTGIFEYHFLDDDTILVALNDVIWTLKRSH